MALPAAFPDSLAAFHAARGDAERLAWSELGEWLAGLAARMPFAAVAALDELGAPRGVINGLLLRGDLARARVTIGKSGLFDLDDGGAPALLIGVREAGAVIDVCAVQSSRADEWALLRGDGAVLGHHALLRCMLGMDDVLPVFGTPLAWLVAGAVGICVLDWAPSVLGQLRGLGPGVTLQCEDARAAEVLARALAWDGLPKVAVRPADNQEDRLAA